MIIQRLREFVPADDLQQIQHHLRTSSGWAFHTYFWRYYLLPNLVPYNQHDPKTWYQNQPGALENLTPPWKRLFDSVFELAGPDFKLMRSSITGQTQNQFPKLHVDVDVDIPGTYRSYLIYLNTEWKDEWGGPTEIESTNNPCHYELPEPGKLIEFDSQLWHVGKPPVVADLLRLTIVLHGKVG